MNLTDLQPNEGSTHRRKRVGRGIGSGHGKTCGRGTKGLKARDTQRPGFEGGQTPLHRRLPHFRGFTQPDKVEYTIINLSDLEAKFDADAVVTPEVLLQNRVIGKIGDGVKVLGSGEITKPLTVHAHKFSQSALDKIGAAGGTTQIV